MSEGGREGAREGLREGGREGGRTDKEKGGRKDQGLCRTHKLIYNITKHTKTVVIFKRTTSKCYYIHLLMVARQI